MHTPLPLFFRGGRIYGSFPVPGYLTRYSLVELRVMFWGTFTTYRGHNTRIHFCSLSVLLRFFNILHSFQRGRNDLFLSLPGRPLRIFSTRQKERRPFWDRLSLICAFFSLGSFNGTSHRKAMCFVDRDCENNQNIQHTVSPSHNVRAVVWTMNVLVRLAFESFSFRCLLYIVKFTKCFSMLTIIYGYL